MHAQVRQRGGTGSEDVHVLPDEQSAEYSVRAFNMGGHDELKCTIIAAKQKVIKAT